MGDPGGLVIDHIDGDGLNNRRANLRLAAHAENMRNQRLRSDSTSGHKGVNWDSTRGKWVARIWLSGKCRHLGCFTSVESASEAYAAAIHESHGAFGRVA
jgi:Rieske Fe-S protein